MTETSELAAQLRLEAKGEHWLQGMLRAAADRLEASEARSASLLEENERLYEEVGDMNALRASVEAQLTAALRRAEAAEARVAELEAALKPFAEVAERIAVIAPGWDHDEFQFSAAAVPQKLAPYRRARDLLNKDNADGK